MTTIEVNKLEAAEIAAWREYKKAVDESQRLLHKWNHAESKWKDAWRTLRAEQQEAAK